MGDWDNSTESELWLTKTIGEVAGSSDASTLETYQGPGGTSAAFRIYNDRIGVDVVVVDSTSIYLEPTELWLPPVWQYFA